ncbi:MAG TPA: CRISPR-associated ring nuclease, partial [Anaerolineae bacterium]|nr:CRISPR-associated ring nuclease [Anaerolineae bacterium]
MNDRTLVMTMGGQPQIVTFALDWLLAQGEAVNQVIILHLFSKDPRLKKAIHQITAEFKGDHYQGHPCRLKLRSITHGGQRPADIQTEADADATWQTAYQLLAELKSQNRTLHICVGGGRRMIALLTMSAAMLLCGHHDRIWHIYTPGQVQERAGNGAMLHARPEDGVRLIQVPMVPWGAYVPALRNLAQPPEKIIARQTAWLDETERQRCAAVIRHLTDRQNEVLQAFAAGHDPQGVAKLLSISLATVNSHK